MLLDIDGEYDFYDVVRDSNGVLSVHYAGYSYPVDSDDENPYRWAMPQGLFVPVAELLGESERTGDSIADTLYDYLGYHTVCFEDLDADGMRQRLDDAVNMSKHLPLCDLSLTTPIGSYYC